MEHNIIPVKEPYTGKEFWACSCGRVMKSAQEVYDHKGTSIKIRKLQNEVLDRLKLVEKDIDEARKCEYMRHIEYLNIGKKEILEWILSKI